GQFTSICDGDFGPALSALGNKIVGALGGQCMTDPLLTSTGNLVCYKGDVIGKNSQGKNITCQETCLDKVDCIIEEITNQGLQTEEKTEVTRCSDALFNNPATQDCGDTCPCWRIVKKESCDPEKFGTPYGLEILRNGDPAPGTVAKASCFTSPYKWGSEDLANMQCQ
ncbi:MAG: hypothetical protein V1754_11535, partial [Pseudomonadota bacterium]